MNGQQWAHVIGAILALGGLTAACTPDAPAPPPPTLSASPPETDLERQERMAFESAERSYRAFRAEFTRLRQRGYSGEPTATMRKYAGGPYLEFFAENLREGEGTKSTRAVEIVGLSRGSYTPRLVTLNVCEDGRKSKSLDSKGQVVGKGAAAQITLRFRPSNGRWILWDGDDKEVKSCRGD